MKLTDQEKISEIQSNFYSSSNNQPFNSIALPLVRRQFPTLFAQKLVSNGPFKVADQLLQNQFQYERKNKNAWSKWKLNPSKERRRIYSR